MIHHALQGPELCQPLGGGLRTAFINPWNVIDAVAHQGQIVDDLIRADTKLLDHARLIERAAAHGVDQSDSGPDQLSEILVAGGHRDIDTLLGCLNGQGPDDIIRLHAGDTQNRKSQCGNDGQHRFDLGAQIVGHCFTIGLVLGEQCVAKGWAGGIHDESGEIRRFLEGRAQHVDDAKQCTRRLASGIAERGQRVERAIQIAGAINQDESIHAAL
jgi:hypothetical protein